MVLLRLPRFRQPPILRAGDRGRARPRSDAPLLAQQAPFAGGVGPEGHPQGIPIRGGTPRPSERVRVCVDLDLGAFQCQAPAAWHPASAGHPPVRNPWVPPAPIEGTNSGLYWNPWVPTRLAVSATTTPPDVTGPRVCDPCTHRHPGGLLSRSTRTGPRGLPSRLNSGPPPACAGAGERSCEVPRG